MTFVDGDDLTSDNPVTAMRAWAREVAMLRPLADMAANRTDDAALTVMRAWTHANKGLEHVTIAYEKYLADILEE
jgi:hypothetical protein